MLQLLQVHYTSYSLKPAPFPASPVLVETPKASWYQDLHELCLGSQQSLLRQMEWVSKWVLEQCSYSQDRVSVILMTLSDYGRREERRAEGTSGKNWVYLGLYSLLSVCYWAGKSYFTQLFGVPWVSLLQSPPKLSGRRLTSSFPVFLQQITKLDLEPFRYWTQSK